MTYTHFYILRLQFLGFRLHGWQKQPKTKTGHEFLDKTLDFVLGEGVPFKSLGAGRTDSKVSALDFPVSLMMTSTIEDEDSFLNLMNDNLPSDMRLLSIAQADPKVNIIQHAKEKEYIYMFAYGEKSHPFSSPFITTLPQTLDIELMQTAAKLFEGTHYLKKYCCKPTENMNFNRLITTCEIKENTLFTANFFPKKSYVLQIKGKGFMRYQIRLMMGMLFEIGKGNISLEDFKKTLSKSDDDTSLRDIAPGSGLHLYGVVFE